MSQVIKNIQKEFYHYKALGDRTFEQLDTDQMNWKSSSESSSIGQIVKHMNGNMLSHWTDFLCSDGEKEWRDRDDEFIDTIKTKPELKNKLWKNVKMLQSGLKKGGFDIGSTQSCVTPVYLEGSVPEAMALVRDLRENYQIFCSIVVYPVIPKGLILLRLIPTSSHNEDDINETLDAFASIREKLESGIYKRAPEGVGKSID